MEPVVDAFSASSTAITTAVTPSDAQFSAADHLFAGCGENGAILAAIDWSNTPLGPVEQWPQSLRTSVRICLTSRHPLFIWWGPQLVKMYNDAYTPVLGKRHPWALGKPGREIWPEIWDVIGPMLEGVLATGKATWSDDQLLLLERNGFQEETYFTYSYSPIQDEFGRVGGIFTAVSETTQRVLAARRGRTARELAAAVVDARSVEDVCAQAARAIADDPNDIPIALLYTLDDGAARACLANAVGLAAGTPVFSPATIDVQTSTPTDPYALGEAIRTRQPVVVPDLQWPADVLTAPSYVWPKSVVTLPMMEPGKATPSAVMVLGVSPRLELDAAYRAFFEQLAGHLATAFAAAHAYEAERKRAEALAEIDRAKTAFFSNVSHEFRTPLTLMLGPLSDLLDAPVEPGASPYSDMPADVRAQLDVVRRNGLRLLKLVNSLLDFSRIEAGRVQANYVPTDLSAFTADLASSFRSLMEKAGLQLEVDCPPLAEPVYIDRDMWEKIVLNLLSNAFKFTFTGGVTVRLRERAGAAELTVSDTGVGVAAEELPRLFERFHRVEGAQARTHEGSGIGLALAQELVHLHGGTISVESAPGAGTTFTVRAPLGASHLPADRIGAPTSLASTAIEVGAFIGEAQRWLPDEPGAWDEAPADAWTDDAPTRPMLRVAGASVRDHAAGKTVARILIADDNADMRDYLTHLLGERYHVETVTNGAQALRAIAGALPDLVISDVMMPVMDGFALLERLRADPRTATLPVMLLSARAGEEATIEGLERGADDYLIKPFSARDALSRVAARLEISRLRQQSERRTRQAFDALLKLAELAVGDDPGASATARIGRRQRGPSTAHALVSLAREVIGCEIASLVGVDRATGRLAPLATLGRDHENEAAWYATLGDYTYTEYYAEAYQRRLESGEVIVADVRGNTRRGVPNYGTRTALTAPLIADGVLYGLLTFAYPQTEHIYTQMERELAADFARMALLILDRARLLSERAEAQAQAKALQETTRRMNEFLGVASHELRTPLTSISANIQIGERMTSNLYDQAPDALAPRLERLNLLLSGANRQAQRLDRLVGDLLDVSRINAGKLELRVEPCDLAPIFTEMVEGQQLAWPGREITLTLPRRATLPLMADPDRIGQVITNFLTNALKYAPVDQPVEAAAQVAGDQVRVTVRDHGPGIPLAAQAHLFEAFYRAPGITQLSGSGVGLGLGLHICQNIIERHNGALGVVSAPGEGATFWFTLPLAPSASARRLPRA